MGPLCLRRWPPGNPTEEGIRLIHAVLGHVARNGFDLVPVPLQTVQGTSYVHDGECLWELSPWMAAKADSGDRPSPARIAAAMVALARFHRAAQGSAVWGRKPGRSTGIGDRLNRARQWLSGGLDELSAQLEPAVCPRLFDRARRVLALAATTGPAIVPRLEAAAEGQVPLQPCIRDIWRNHVLFQEDRVSGLNWCDWIYRQHRAFADWEAVGARLDEIVKRLEHLVRAWQHPSPPGR